jgi:molybdenum cofactor biosynthesis protein B
MPEPSEGVAVALIVLSGSDAEGPRAALAEAGHRLVGVETIPQDVTRLKGIMAAGLGDPRIEALIAVGGREHGGVVEAVEGLMDVRLPGFQEIYRMLCFQEMGSQAIYARAGAGVTRGRVLLCLPGSDRSVALGLERLILPELARLRTLARGG